MLALLRRTIATLTGRRSLEAASGGRRAAGVRSMANLNSAIIAQAALAGRRASYSAANNPWTQAGLDSFVANLVGTGIKPRPKHPDDKVRRRLVELWERWVPHADPSGVADFYGLQALAARGMLETGEQFGRMAVRRNPGPVPLRIELVHRDQVPTDRFAELADGGRVRAGIEFGPAGERVAFHVLPSRPGDPYAPPGLAWETVRVPAADMLHLYRATEGGQLRGVTKLASSLLRLSNLDEYEEAALVRAKASAMLMGFLRDQANGGGADALADLFEGDIGALALEPGTIQPLPPGTDIEFTTPPDDRNLSTFQRGALRGAAAGLGVTYEQLTGDYADVTYSSVRASLVEFRRKAEQLQHLVIVHQFCRPVWERFVTLAALTGQVDAADFARDPGAYLAAEWLVPRWEHVDPQKDVDAELSEIREGLKSRTQAVAERGYDIERLDEEIAADRRREAGLSLSFNAAPQGGPTGPSQDPPQ